MMSLNERRNLADRLRQTRARLLARSEVTLSQLPIDLQNEVRALPGLGAITTSGLEKIKSLVDRIDWGIYFLLDPNFPANQQSDQRLQPAKTGAQDQTTTPTATVNASDAPRSAKPAELSSARPIDFGPFAAKSGGSNG